MLLKSPTGAIMTWLIGLVCYSWAKVVTVNNKTIKHYGEIGETYSLDQSIFSNRKYQFASLSSNFHLATTDPGKMDFLSYLGDKGTVKKSMIIATAKEQMRVFLIQKKKSSNLILLYKDCKKSSGSSEKEFSHDSLKDITFYLMKGYKTSQIIMAGSKYLKSSNQTKIYLYFVDFRPQKGPKPGFFPKKDQAPKILTVDGKFVIDENTDQASNAHFKHRDGEGSLLFYNRLNSMHSFNDDENKWKKNSLVVFVWVRFYQFNPNKLEAKSLRMPVDYISGFSLLLSDRRENSKTKCLLHYIYYQHEKDPKGYIYSKADITLENLSNAYGQYFHIDNDFHKYPRYSIKNSAENSQEKPFCLLWNGEGDKYTPFILYSKYLPKNPPESTFTILVPDDKTNSTLPVTLKKDQKKPQFKHPGKRTQMVLETVAYFAKNKDRNDREVKTPQPSQYISIKHFRDNRIIHLDIFVDLDRTREEVKDPKDSAIITSYSFKEAYFKRLNLFDSDDAYFFFYDNGEFWNMGGNYTVHNPDFTIMSRKNNLIKELTMKFKPPSATKKVKADGQRIVLNYSAPSKINSVSYPASLTLKSYALADIPDPDSATTSTFYQTLTFNLIQGAGYFDDIFLAKSNETINQIFSNSFEELSLTHSQIRGNNLTAEMKIVKIAGGKVFLIDQKAMPIEMKRIDKVTQETQADEIFWVRGGAIYEEHNKKLGFLECSEKIDPKTRKIIMECLSVTTQNFTENNNKMGIVGVKDMTEKCGGVFIILKNFKDNKRHFYFYVQKKGSTSSKFIYLDKPLGWNKPYFLTCSEKYALIIPYQKNSTGEIKKFSKELTPDSTGSDSKMEKLSDFANNDEGPLQMEAQYRPQGKSYIKYVYDAYPKGFKITSFHSETENDQDFKLKINGYREEYRDGPYNPFDICLMQNSYLVFPKNRSANQPIYIYPGQFYNVSLFYQQKHTQLYDQYKLNLSKVGYENYSRIECHQIKENIDMFTVIGTTKKEKESHKTMITTFVAHKDFHSRIYYQMVTKRVFQETILWTDGIDYIYLRVKEMKASKETYRIQIPKPDTKRIKLFFDKIDTSQPTELVVTFKNDVKAVEYKVKAEFAQLEKLETQSFDPLLVFKAGTYDLSKLFKSFKGSISSISLDPPNPNIKIKSNRVNKDKSLAFPSSQTITSNIVLLGESFPKGVVFYFPNSKKLFIFYENKFLGLSGCDNSKLKGSAKLLVSFHNDTQKLYILRNLDVTTEMLSVDLKAANPSCTIETNNFGTVETSKYLYMTPIEYMNPKSNNEYKNFLFSVSTNLKTFSYYQDDTKVKEDNENPKKIRILSAGATQNYDNYEAQICDLIRTPTKYDQYIHLCISIKKSANSGANKIELLISYPHKNKNSVQPVFERLEDKPLDPKVSFDYLACAYSKPTQIYCVYNGYKDFSLNIKPPEAPTDEFPADTQALTEDHVTFKNGKGLQKQFSYSIKKIHNSGQYICLVTFDSQFEGHRNFLRLIFYKVGSSSVYYLESYGFVGKFTSIKTGFLEPAKFFVAYPGAEIKQNAMQVYSLDSLKLEISSKKLAEIASTKLVIKSETSMNGAKQIPFSKIFYEKKIPVPEKPKTFLEKYWWLILLLSVVGLLVAGLLTFYFIRRARLLRELRMKDDTVINDLRDFHFY